MTGEQKQPLRRQATFDIAGLEGFCTVLAAQLRAGDCLLLNGPLGSGKTQIVKFLAQALKCSDPVTSPTYGLANFYATQSMPILHIDTYRLSSIDEFHQLGLDEYFDSHLTLVEWGDQVKNEFYDHLELWLDFATEKQATGSNEQRRRIEFTGRGKRWTPVIESIPQVDSPFDHGEQTQEKS